MNSLFQTVFCLLSLISLFIFVIMAVFKLRISKKQCLLLLVPMIIFMAALAYGFDYEANVNNDLKRYIRDVNNIRQLGFWAKLYAAESHTIIFRIVLWLTSLSDNYYWLPCFITLFEFGLYGYILADVQERFGFSGLEILYCLIFKLALLPPIITIAAFKNTLAISFFIWFLYLHYVVGSEKRLKYILPLMAIFTHSQAIVPIVLLLLALKFRGKVWILILALLPFFFRVLEYLLNLLPFDLTQRYAFKLALYATHPTEFDTNKAKLILCFFVILFIIQIIVYTRRKTSNKIFTDYIFYLMVFMIGCSVTFPELFLRLSYVISFSFPFLLAFNEIALIENESVHVKQNIIKMVNVALLLSAGIAMVVTRGCWLTQIYWFSIL